MKLQTGIGLLTVVSMVAIGGDQYLWSLPRVLEITCHFIFAIGFGYLVAWPALKKDLKSSQTSQRDHVCPTCGQKTTQPSIERDTKTVG